MLTINQLTADAINAQASVIAELRTNTAGAEPWDRAGIASVLRSLGTHGLDVIIPAALAAAADPAARTPAAISWPQYRQAGRPPTVSDPPDQRAKCEHCGRIERICRAVQARQPGLDDHEFRPHEWRRL